MNVETEGPGGVQRAGGGGQKFAEGNLESGYEVPGFEVLKRCFRSKNGRTVLLTAGACPAAVYAYRRTRLCPPWRAESTRCICLSVFVLFVGTIRTVKNGSSQKSYANFCEGAEG